MIIYSQNKEIEFGIEKCTMLVMDNGKRQTKEWIEPANQVKIRTLREKETYKYLGILEAEIIKQVKIKEKKEYSEEQESYSKTNYKARTL